MGQSNTNCRELASNTGTQETRNFITEHICGLLEKARF
jgi:hypothetical protein